MDKEFKLPELGENIDSAKVVSVLVKEGDSVEIDQVLIEIETDKATIEVPSTIKGIVKKVLAKNGEDVKVGQAIIVFDSADSGIKQDAPAEVSPASSVPTAVDSAQPEVVKEVVAPLQSGGLVEMVLPELGENISDALVAVVLVKPGDILEKDQAVLEIETDKATIEVPSTIEGVVKEVMAKVGEKVKVGDVIVKAESSVSVKPEKKADVVQSPVAAETVTDVKTLAVDESKPVKGEKEKAEPGEIDKQPPIKKGSAPAAPSVRRIAREIGVDINEVSGSGPGGRISMDDVKAYSKKLHEQVKLGIGAVGSMVNIKKESLPDFSKYGGIDVQPMNNIRAKTADHLSYAWSVIPHVTQHDKADITELEEVRKKINSRLDKSAAKLTVTTILVKVLEAALKKFPQFNSSIDLEKHEIIYKKYFNIGIAVDTDFGLIVPVLKNVNNKTLTELSAELNTLAEKARIKKIALEDLQGANMTITNLGGIGGTSFTPIVNSPEVAILGVSRGTFEPVYKDNSFVPKLMMPLSLSYDHRIIDGADAARFLRFICEILEEPLRIIL